MAAEGAGAATAHNGRTSRAEAHEIVLKKDRPVRHEHPFDVAADRPAALVLGEFANLHAGTIEKREIRLCPCRATLRVEQQIRLHEIAGTGRQSIKSSHIAIDSAAATNQPGVNKCRASANARPIEHIANADHPDAHLVVAADLAAAGKATIGTGGFYTVGDVGHFQMRPGAANIGTDMASPRPELFSAGQLPKPGRQPDQLWRQQAAAMTDFASSSSRARYKRRAANSFLKARNWKAWLISPGSERPAPCLCQQELSLCPYSHRGRRQEPEHK